jgi:hypothetical protein
MMSALHNNFKDKQQLCATSSCEDCKNDANKCVN